MAVWLGDAGLGGRRLQRNFAAKHAEPLYTDFSWLANLARRRPSAGKQHRNDEWSTGHENCFAEHADSKWTGPGGSRSAEWRSACGLKDVIGAAE